MPNTPAADPGRSPRRCRAAEWSLFVLVALLVGWCYFNDKADRREFLSPTAPSYYGLLTEALAAGRTNLNIVADIKFLRLKNPYAGPQDTLRPHDMSYYKGKFYIYYGITPALILMLPWLVATGKFLTEPAAIGIFCYGGFLLGGWWLVRLRQLTLPNVSPVFSIFAVLVWGLGTPVFFLSQQHTFYAVPITAAFFCLMAVIACLDLALRSLTRRRALFWLAAASLMHGLAVGARPNYALGLPFLLIPAWLVWRRHAVPSSRTWPAVAAAVILPAALVGAGLAWYNQARFENPFDFGIRFSLATEDIRNLRMIGLDYIPKNLRLYLLQPAEFIRYYPFVYNDNEPFGVLPHLPLAGLALLLPALLFFRRVRQDRAWAGVSAVLLGCALANLFMLSLFFGGVDRYLVDFAPPALLGGLGLLLWLADRDLAAPRPLRRALLAAVLLVGGWTLGNGIGFGLSLQSPSPVHERLEWIANTAAYYVERIFGTAYGPLEAEIVFPAQTVAGLREPILSTGYLRKSGDIIYAIYPDAGHVQFGFFHLGSGGPISEPVAIERGRPYRLTVQLGSLYPVPRRHPLFRRWTDEQIKAQQRKFSLSLDGRVVMRAEVAVYASTPGGVHVGENRLAANVSQPRFSGRITAPHRLPFPAPPDLEHDSITGPVRIRFRVPYDPTDNYQPLICTGRSGAGDMLNIQIRSDGKFKFMHDDWGGGGFESELVEPAPGPEQVVEVEMGSLYPAGRPGVPDNLRHRLAVWLNGRLIMDLTRPFNPSTAGEIVFGYNAIQAGTAQQMFSGSIQAIESIPSRPPAHTP
jgi:hypothetical protein